MSLNGRDRRHAYRRFAAGGNGHEQRDPRDVAEFESLKQRIRELEFNKSHLEDDDYHRRFAARGNGNGYHHPDDHREFTIKGSDEEHCQSDDLAGKHEFLYESFPIFDEYMDKDWYSWMTISCTIGDVDQPTRRSVQSLISEESKKSTNKESSDVARISVDSINELWKTGVVEEGQPSKDVFLKIKEDPIRMETNFQVSQSLTSLSKNKEGRAKFVTNVRKSKWLSDDQEHKIEVDTGDDTQELGTTYFVYIASQLHDSFNGCLQSDNLFGCITNFPFDPGGLVKAFDGLDSRTSPFQAGEDDTDPDLYQS